MNKLYFLLSLLLGTVITLPMQATNIKYYNNFRQITDAQPSNNQVFITAKGGILLYDQIAHTSRFITKENSNLASNEVEQVAKSNINGDIWIGTYDNGLARWDGNDFVNAPYPSNFGLLYNMKFGPDGNIYLQSSNGAFKYNVLSKTYTKFNETNTGIWLYDAWSFDFNSDGNLVIFTGTTCLVTDVNTMQVIDSFQTLVTPLVVGCSSSTSTIYYMNADEVLFLRGNFELGYIHRDGTSSDAAVGLPVFTTVELMRGTDNSLYALVDNQWVYKLVGHTWQYAYSTGTGVFASRIFYEDGTTSCLNIIDTDMNDKLVDMYTHDMTATHQEIYTDKYVFNSNNMSSLFADDAGDIYTVTSSTIYKFDKLHDDWSLYNTAPSIFGEIRNVRWYNGKIYAVNYGRLIEFFDGTTWTQIPLAAGASSNYVFDYDVTPDDVIYFSNEEGVFKYEAGTTTRLITSNTTVSSTWVTALAFKAYNNELWMSKQNQIIQFNLTSSTQTVFNHSVNAALPTTLNISDIQINPVDRAIWFLQNDNLLIQLKDAVFTTITVPDLALNFINKIQFHNENDFVVTLTDGSTGNGFYTYINGVWTKYHSATTPEIICDSYSDVLIDNSGDYWFSNYCDVGVNTFKNANTSTASPTSSISFLVYPNPAAEQVQVVNPFHSAQVIEIYDMLGHQVYKNTMEESGSISIPVAKWNSGFYEIKMATKTQKLFIQH